MMFKFTKAQIATLAVGLVIAVSGAVQSALETNGNMSPAALLPVVGAAAGKFAVSFLTAWLMGQVKEAEQAGSTTPEVAPVPVSVEERAGGKAEQGQGMVEYALILFLVAVVVIGILVVLGPQVGSVFSSVHTGLGGGIQATPAPTP